MIFNAIANRNLAFFRSRTPINDVTAGAHDLHSSSAYAVSDRCVSSRRTRKGIQPAPGPWSTGRWLESVGYVRSGQGDRRPHTQARTNGTTLLFFRVNAPSHHVRSDRYASSRPR